jgi:hypothetical protein
MLFTVIKTNFKCNFSILILFTDFLIDFLLLDHCSPKILKDFNLSTVHFVKNLLKNILAELLEDAHYNGKAFKREPIFPKLKPAWVHMVANVSGRIH